jgi:hypothetical protein
VEGSGVVHGFQFRVVGGEARAEDGDALTEVRGHRFEVRVILYNTKYFAYLSEGLL